jgi:imidazolonepropionase-like amidohydrolase
MIPSFVEHGVSIVPTLVNIATFPEIAASANERFPIYASHMRALHARRRATVAAAHDAGIAIYAGTDAGSRIPHGLIAQEVLELVTVGLSPTEAISAACWDARRWLGYEGLEEGASADLVVYDEDPRATPRVLTDPATVMLRGRIVSTRDRRAG